MFKFPIASLLKGAASDAIQGRAPQAIMQGVTAKSADYAVNYGRGIAQSALNAGLSKANRKLGLGLGHASVEHLIDNPVGALTQILGNGNLGIGDGGLGGWMAQLVSRPDPLLEIDWIPELPFGLPAEYVEEISFTWPRFVTNDAIPNHGQSLYIVEGREVSAITLVFYEDVKLTTSRWVELWRGLICPDGIHYNYPDTYKQSIFAYPSDVNRRPLGKFEFRGCFPTGLPQYHMAGDGSNRVRLSVEFSVDTIEIDLGGGGFGALAGLQRGGILSLVTNKINQAANQALQPYLPAINATYNGAVGMVNDAANNVKGAFSKLF